MKTFKISYRKVKISISLRGGNFHFQPEVKVTCIPKKSHLGVNFTSPTCNMLLRNLNLRKLEKFRIMSKFNGIIPKCPVPPQKENFANTSKRLPENGN